VHGSVSLTKSCLIQTIVRFELVAALAQRWLREADSDLTPTEKLNFAKVIADSSDKRDRVLLRLDLDKDPADFLDALYTTPAASSEAGNGDGRPPARPATATGTGRPSATGPRHKRRQRPQRGMKREPATDAIPQRAGPGGAIRGRRRRGAACADRRPAGSDSGVGDEHRRNTADREERRSAVPRSAATRPQPAAEQKTAAGGLQRRRGLAAGLRTGARCRRRPTAATWWGTSVVHPTGSRGFTEVKNA